MLRVLIALLMVFTTSWVNAETPRYEEPEIGVVKKQQATVNEAMKHANQIMQDGSLDKILNQERNKLNSLPRTMKGLNVQLPEYLETERNDRYMAKALAAGKAIDEAKNKPFEAKYPIVLISLSMPESKIKSLIEEAYTIGAAIAVQGLIGDDFQETLVKLKQLAGDMDGGVMIDPTLFRRFEVTAAPTFVLPLEPLQQCTDKGCPTPLHVKATGSATFQYFLDLVARTGADKEKAEANVWLAKYGD